MQNFERVFVQFQKANKTIKLAPISRCFSSDKPVADTILNNNEVKKNIEENQEQKQNISADSIKASSFAQAFEKFTALDKQNVVKEASFASLLRHSNLMHLGDPEGKIVVGQIFEVIKNDLYIDFGWKFHCVCPKPLKNNSDYVRGAKVRLRIKDLELSTKFLGSTKDVTLLEADCILLGLVSTPNKINKTVDSTAVSTA